MFIVALSNEFLKNIPNAPSEVNKESRSPSGLRKTIFIFNSLAHRTTWLRSDLSEDAEFDYMHPVNTFAILVDAIKVGYVSVPHPVVLANVDKKCAIAFLEIYTEAFASVKADTNSYKEPSKFPAIDIDMTFVADVGAVVFSDVVKAAKAVSGELLDTVQYKDVYTDTDGVSALTLRFSFVSADRTLTKQELQSTTDAVAESLKSLGLVIKA